MSTETARNTSAPRWMLWTGWFLSFVVVAQLLTSACQLVPFRRSA
jgi:hypothetical protein